MLPAPAGRASRLDIDRFVATNQPVWDRLGELTARGGRGLRNLSGAELEELVRLYQRVSTHLSYARTYYRDPALTSTLTRLVSRAGALVHGTRPRTLGAVARFFSLTFPAAVWHSRRFVLAGAVLFLLPALAMGVWIANSDAALEASAPAEVREAYVEHQFEDYYSSAPAAAFASQIFTNNVQVAILAFAVGIAVCVPTALVLAVNGANLGVAAGLFSAAGQEGRFWGLILPHGLLEITAICVAAAAGLRLGWVLVDPGDRSRAAALSEEGRRAIVVVVGLILVFGIAGLIEATITGSGLPTWFRVGVGVAVEAAFVAYVVVQGRAAAAAGITGSLGEEERARSRLTAVKASRSP